MIAETRDPEILNYFANHPDIAFNLDFTGAMRDSVIYLAGEHGCFCFEWCAPGTYEVHVMLTKAGRGAWGFAAARHALAMISGMGVSHLWARVDTPQLAYFTRKAGFQEVEPRAFFPSPALYRIFEWRKACPQQS